MTISTVVLVASLLMIGGVLASKLSSRWGVPALLLFLAIGMLAGSEGLLGIPFDNPEVAMFVGSVALSLILFAGGLQTETADLDKRVAVRGGILATFGVLLTAGLTALFSIFVLGMGWKQGMLIGAILSSTDAAAVFSVLKNSGVGIPARLRTVLEFESGANDPAAVFLTTLVISAVTFSDFTSPLLIVSFAYKVAFGALLGWLFGRGIAWLLDRIDLEQDGLYPVLMLASVGVVFGVSEALGSSGFMASYTAGLSLAGRVFIHRGSLVRFHEGLSWLMQIAMFLILGLLVFPSQIPGQMAVATAVSAFLIVIARPAAVFLSLWRSEFGLRERVFLSAVGLRGATPIILATFPMAAGVAGSDAIFNAVFFAVVISVLLQGTGMGWLARKLRIATPLQPVCAAPIEVVAPGDIGMSIRRLQVAQGCPAQGEKLLKVGGPDMPLVVMLRRDGVVFVPSGGSRLETGDELFVLGDEESVNRMAVLVGVASAAPQA